MNRKPIGAYATEGGTYAGYDKDGLSWPIEPDLAKELEAGRADRNAKAGKQPS